MGLKPRTLGTNLHSNVTHVNVPENMFATLKDSSGEKKCIIAHTSRTFPNTGAIRIMTEAKAERTC
jgi:hypothetical protein